MHILKDLQNVLQIFIVIFGLSIIEMTWDDRTNFEYPEKNFLPNCLILRDLQKFVKNFLSYSDLALSIRLEMIKNILKIETKYISLICIFWVFKRHVKVLMLIFRFRIIEFYEIHIEISIITYLLKTKGVCKNTLGERC